MTWRQWNAARQLLAEEFLGKYVRASAHAEDAAFASATSHAPRG